MRNWVASFLIDTRERLAETDAIERVTQRDDRARGARRSITRR